MPNNAEDQTRPRVPDREHDQLLLAARHYLRLTKRLVKRFPETGGRRIGDIPHSPGRLSREELAFAHLASSAMRIATIAERIGHPRQYKQLLYDNRFQRKPEYTEAEVADWFAKNGNNELPFLLRDNVGHKEGEGHLGEDRAAFLRRVEIAEAIQILGAALGKLEREALAGEPGSQSG